MAGGHCDQYTSGHCPVLTTMIRHQHDNNEQPISKTMQYKKITKPLLERKRRARMNACLEELKEIMTGCLQSEGENNISKLGRLNFFIHSWLDKGCFSLILIISTECPNK